MDIQLDAAGFLKEYVPEPTSLPAPEWTGKEIAQLLAHLGVPASLSVITLVNGERKASSYRLQAGDAVKLIPLATGG